MAFFPARPPGLSAAERPEPFRLWSGSAREQRQRAARVMRNLERSTVPSRDILVRCIVVAFKKEFFKRAKIQLDDYKLLELAEKLAQAIEYKYWSLPLREQDTCYPDRSPVSVIVLPLHDSPSEKDVQVVGHKVTVLYKDKTVLQKLVDGQSDKAMLEELIKVARDLASDAFLRMHQLA